MACSSCCFCFFIISFHLPSTVKSEDLSRLFNLFLDCFFSDSLQATVNSVSSCHFGACLDFFSVVFFCLVLSLTVSVAWVPGCGGRLPLGPSLLGPKRLSQVCLQPGSLWTWFGCFSLSFSGPRRSQGIWGKSN